MKRIELKPNSRQDMNYLILDYNSVFVAKEEPRIILQHIQSIELQKPMLSSYYLDTMGIVPYCLQVMDMLNNDFVSGFAKIEGCKQKLQSELIKGNSNLYAVWEASGILSQLKLALNNSYAFDALPQCNIALSMGRDAVIREVGRAANNSAIQIIGQALSLAFKVYDVSNAFQMFCFYNTIIERINEHTPYPNERNLYNWAKAQRAYAFFAVASSTLGGVANIAHIVDEAIAQHDIENYGQQPLAFI